MDLIQLQYAARKAKERRRELEIRARALKSHIEIGLSLYKRTSNENFLCILIAIVAHSTDSICCKEHIETIKRGYNMAIERGILVRVE